MKEATGELNMTAITLVAIGAILAFFYFFIWPSIQTGLKLNTACNISGGNTYEDGDGDDKITCGDGECKVGNNKKQCDSKNAK